MKFFLSLQVSYHVIKFCLIHFFIKSFDSVFGGHVPYQAKIDVCVVITSVLRTSHITDSYRERLPSVIMTVQCMAQRCGFHLQHCPYVRDTVGTVG